jgi:8-oxo-dGTP pyrophosphatase MutT (NUDIX family)
VIRPIAICVIRRRDEILVFESRDTVKNETFYRPLGGGINFGEHGKDAVRREIFEEIGSQISTPKHLGMIESVFVLNGVPRHELVQVYEASLVDKSLYQAASLTVHEDDGTTHPAVWKTVGDFRIGAAILYPEGLLALLD